MSEHEAWLARRAGCGGDQHAFEDLLGANRVEAPTTSARRSPRKDTSADDLFQIVSIKLWSEIERGHYNPHRADFVHFASTVARQALAEDLRWRRREKRHAHDRARIDRHRSTCPAMIRTRRSGTRGDDRLPPGSTGPW